jgi:hypothetical protein
MILGQYRDDREFLQPKASHDTGLEGRDTRRYANAQVTGGGTKQEYLDEAVASREAIGFFASSALIGYRCANSGGFRLS